MSPFRFVRPFLVVLLTASLSLSIAASGEEPAKPKKKKTQQTEQTSEPVPVAAATPPGVAVPAPEVLLMLVRNSIAALNQANFTGNYTVLRDIGSPSLQSASSADLAIAFVNLRQQKVDLSPALILTPALTEQPAVAADGVLRLAGNFPTKPLRIDFVMTFQPVQGIWRLHGLSVNTPQAQP